MTSTLVAAAPMEQMTYIYAAPELLRYLLDLVAVFGSRRSDVYSFAILMWEVLTLQTPFQAFNIANYFLLAQAVADESNRRYPLRPSLDALPGDAPEGIARLIAECWSPERKHRPLAGECSQRLKVMLDTARAAEVRSPVPTPVPVPGHVPVPPPPTGSDPLEAMRAQLATLQARLDQAEVVYWAMRDCTPCFCAA
jgi:serine/threonine protein kinase